MSTGPGISSIETVLATLRRGQRQLTRNPRAAVQSAVRQLLAGGQTSPPQEPEGEEASYRIDDLARLSGVTVRNIRAYQERGLLPPPRRVGRTAHFDRSHLARLRIICSMLDRGYTAANILEMLYAWEEGRDLGAVLGLETALVPETGDQPLTTTLPEARRLAGGADDYDLLLEVGLIERVGSRARVLRPRLLETFVEMREHGMPTQALVDVYVGVQPSVDAIAQKLVAAGAAQLAPRFFEQDSATSADVGELVALLTRFRALAMSALTATVAASIEEAIEDLLADYLAERVLGNEADAG